MSSIPLHYSTFHVGSAHVDPELAGLSVLTWNLSLPTRGVDRSRPDVILARLAEDPILLQRSHPYTRLTYLGFNLTLRLSRVAVRPQLASLILSHHFHPSHQTLHEIRTISASISRVVFLDQNRCNLKRENLREVLAPSLNPQQGQVS